VVIVRCLYQVTGSRLCVILYNDHGGDGSLLLLQGVRLYFADWGYSTPQQKARAAAHHRIRSIDLNDFSCMCRVVLPPRYVSHVPHSP
jgi:hypothetical protein